MQQVKNHRPSFSANVTNQLKKFSNKIFSLNQIKDLNFQTMNAYDFLTQDFEFLTFESLIFLNMEVFFKELKTYWIHLINKYILNYITESADLPIVEKLLEGFSVDLNAKQQSQVNSLIISGIYLILEKSSLICYIGQSKDIYMRLGQHKEMLLNQEHHNYQLQENFNKSGIDDFEFLVLFFGSTMKEKKAREELEQQYIDQWPGPLFNIKGNSKFKFTNFKEPFFD